VLRTHVGAPSREVEYLVLGADARPRQIDRAAWAALGDRDAWVTVPTGDPGRVSDRLQEHGLRTATDPEWLMTVPLASRVGATLAPDFRHSLHWTGRDRAEITVLGPDGAVAASGQLGLADAWAVPDRIETTRAHRRRGLGRAVMTALVDAARERGGQHGVLVASDAGRRLYLSLGWTVVSGVTTGR
jgi:GNAT superfamily N-acetyltransferase